MNARSILLAAMLGLAAGTAAADSSAEFTLRADGRSANGRGPLAQADALAPGLTPATPSGLTLQAELRHTLRVGRGLSLHGNGLLAHERLEGRRGRDASRVNELHVAWDLGAWQLAAGKKVLGWDVGYGFRPNDVVQQEVRRTQFGQTPEGRPLLNSVTGEEERLERVLPLARRYNGPVVAISNDDSGISEDPDVRFAVARRIVERAADHGIPAHDIVVDPLVMPVGAMASAGRQVFALVRRLREELGVNTTCGASNISFGLPNRHGINAAFLPMAIAAGMTSAIMNPVRAAEMEAVRAANLLMERDPNGADWIRFARVIDPVAAGRPFPEAAAEAAAPRTGRDGTRRRRG